MQENSKASITKSIVHNKRKISLGNKVEDIIDDRGSDLSE